MSPHGDDPLQRLEPFLGTSFLGTWSIEAILPDAPPTNARATYLQHYFDSRGVARVWTPSRSEPDFSPLGFQQRWTGTFSDVGDTIAGRWETSRDGDDWEHDFDLPYERLGCPRAHCDGRPLVGRYRRGRRRCGGPARRSSWRTG